MPDPLRQRAFDRGRILYAARGGDPEKRISWMTSADWYSLESCVAEAERDFLEQCNTGE